MEEVKAENRSIFSGVLAPLSVPDCRRLLVGNALWWQARFMEMIATGWLVLEITNSVWLVALVGFYRSAPLLVLGFFSGQVADRFGRRTVILCSQGAVLAVTCAIVLLLWADRLAFWHLALAAVLLGTAWAVDWPTRRAILPDLIGRERTMDGMLLEGFFQNIARIIGPFGAGILIEVLGATGCFAALAGLSALALLILLGLSRQPAPSPGQLEKASPWATMVEGLRYIRGHPTIPGVLLVTVMVNTLVFPYQTLLPVFARDILGQGPVGLGLLGAASGIGSFVGLLVINRIRRFLSPGRIYAAGSLLLSVAVVTFAVSTSYPLSIALLILAGMGHACFSVMQSTIVLTSSSDDMRDRAMGALVLAIGGGPLGRLQMGALAAAFGASTAVSLTGSIAALTILGVTAAFPAIRKRKKQTDAP